MKLTLADAAGTLTYEVHMDRTLAEVVAETGDTTSLRQRAGSMGYTGLRREVVERQRDAIMAAEHEYLNLSAEERRRRADPYAED